MNCQYFVTVVVILISTLAYYVYKHFNEKKRRRFVFEKWSNTPKDEVILHGCPRGRTLPTVAIFALKVETYLRLAGIKYTPDASTDMGPKGKVPWITINGQHISDSEFIIEFLTKKFGKDLNANRAEADVALARITRVMLEEFFVWGSTLERFVFGDPKGFLQVSGMNPPDPKGFMSNMKKTMMKRAYEQGVGRHTEDEIVNLMTKYLKTVSTALGEKKYFGGDEMCQEDCGIFGILAQCVWALPNSPYEKLMNGECRNLKEYCYRIKENAWPDWDEIVRI